MKILKLKWLGMVSLAFFLTMACENETLEPQPDAQGLSQSLDTKSDTDNSETKLFDGLIVFYEGNDGMQDIVHTTDDGPGQNFKPAQNDEARSVVLFGVRPGCTIEVYDDPQAKKTDDFCIIKVLALADQYTVSTFERTYRDDVVQVTYVRKNGLDGKVSRIKIN